MVDVPATEPVMTPEVAVPTVALPLLLLHVPPAGVPVRVVVRPAHTLAVPEIERLPVPTVTVVVT